jgi:hypothetical protein
MLLRKQNTYFNKDGDGSIGFCHELTKDEKEARRLEKERREAIAVVEESKLYLPPRISKPGISGGTKEIIYRMTKTCKWRERLRIFAGHVAAVYRN